MSHDTCGMVELVNVIMVRNDVKVAVRICPNLAVIGTGQPPAQYGRGENREKCQRSEPSSCGRQKAIYNTLHADRVCRPQVDGVDRLPSAKGVEADVLLRISESPGEPDEFRVTRDKHLRIDLSRRKGDGRGPKANEPPIKMAAQVKTVISQAGRSVRIARNRRDNT